MKKIFTLLVLMLTVMGAKAADVVLFEADFTQSPWAGHTFTHQEEFNGIYCYSNSDKDNCGSISTAGVMTYMKGGNKNTNRYYAIKVTGVNGKMTVVFTMDGSKNLRYSIGEETEYSGTTANTNIELKDASEYTVDYTMTGGGTDAIVYFGQQSSSATSGLKGVKITTPDASTAITYEITEVTLNGTAISASQLSTLTTSKALTMSDAFVGLPTVKYTVKTTVTSSDGSKETSETITADVVEDGENYSATLSAGTDDYVVTFTNITMINTLVVTEETTVLLTKENITSQGYLSVTTNNWSSGKTYAGISGDFYNMSSTDRQININVEGAQYIEVFVQNTNADRKYSVNGTTVTHKGTGVESSGVIAISDGTIVIGGGGQSVYPVYAKFYTELPAVTVAIPASGYATFCNANDVVSTGECYKATKLEGGKVTIEPVTGVIPAGTGIIVKGETSVKLSFAAAGAAAADLEGNKMVGVLADTDLTGKQCYILSAGAFWPCTGGTLAAGKAYLDIAPTSGDAKVIDVEVDGDETAISTVNADQQSNSIYTINGIQVKNAQQKGIYIINGKKVVK